MIGWQSIITAKVAADRLLHKTPLIYSEGISALTGHRVFLKLENLQKTGAFKIRGALNKVVQLTPDVRKCGLIAASTGNHGKGLAYVARLYEVPATVVVSERTPTVKVEAIRRMGAKVLVNGRSYAEAESEAIALAKRENLIYVHSFDDDDVIAGQATVVCEVLEDLPEAEALIVPVGGGALLAGSLFCGKKLKPSLRVIGVEADGAAALHLARQNGSPTPLEGVRTLADGMAVCKVGERCFDIAQNMMDGLVRVTDDEMIEAVRCLLINDKQVTELAGAASVAGLLRGEISLPPRTNVVCIVSGGNIDKALLRRILNGEPITDSDSDSGSGSDSGSE